MVSLHVQLLCKCSSGMLDMHASNTLNLQNTTIYSIYFFFLAYMSFSYLDAVLNFDTPLYGNFESEMHHLVYVEVGLHSTKLKPK